MYFFIRKQLVGCRSFDAWVDLFLNLFLVCLSNILKVSLSVNMVNVKNYLNLDLVWPKINRVLYFYLSIKFIVNLAQDFFYIDIHQTTPCLTQCFTLELQALRSLDLSPPLFDPPFFKFRAPCGHDSKLRADHPELPTLHLRKNGEGWVKPVELFAR